MAAPMSKMSFANFTKLCSFCAQIEFQHRLAFSYGALNRAAPYLFSVSAQTRTIVSNKHYDPRWRKLRAQKVMKMDLPDYEKLRRDSKMSPDEQRTHMKREGIDPPRTHQERDLVLACTNLLFESYVPPEGDGVASVVSGERVKQGMQLLGKKTTSYKSMRKIRQYEPFDSQNFAEEALEAYKETHELLQDITENEVKLHEMVTEKAYPEMVWLLQKKTFRWKYIMGLESPRVVHVRATDLLSKENIFAQVTVRFHSQQTLAIYDRFGRLSYGSEHQVKDTLEYVVFEKHITDENSRWRIHGKVIPNWMPQRQTVLKTMRKPEFKDPDEEDDKAVDKVKETAAVKS